jgi:signal transduction histidine kinase
VSAFQASTSGPAFTVGYALSALPPVVLAHLLLSYPDGVLRERLDRRALAAVYMAVIPIPLLQLLVYDPAQHDIGINGCRTTCAESFVAIAPGADAFAVLSGVQIAVYSVAAVGLTVLVTRHFRRLPTRSPWLVGVMLIVAVLIAVRVVVGNVLYASGEAQEYDRLLFWTSAGALMALAAALMIGLLRRGLAQAAIAGLVVELERAQPSQVEGVLARAVGDPSLRVALWLPERERYVDAAGEHVELPAPGTGRAVTYLRGDRAPLAAIVHDPAAGETPGLIEAAAAAARLALENTQLHAEVRAQLAEVQRSRTRIVEATDAERRRVERDLHDGAQQRLVALALSLRIAERKLGAADNPALEQVLNNTVAELQLAVRELRELARGVYPTVLAEDGLASALKSVAARTPLDVTLSGLPEERLQPDVEAAAYFVACEALANAVKHAGASGVAISVERHDSVLRIAVTDDGAGGARTSPGSGLAGLVDRVEAHGGRLDIDSPRGHGTTIAAEIPCGR